MIIFYIFAGLLIVQGLASLWEGFRYLSYIRANVASPQSLARDEILMRKRDETLPRAAIFAPCKGIDAAMNEYLRALFELDYPNYQIFFIVESREDSAAAEIERWQHRYPAIEARCLVAGLSDNCGQKVHNLLAALDQVDDEIAVYAFVDSDVCPARGWLRELVAPLSDGSVGATTGYRWFIPTDGRFASLLRSAWNGSIATTLGGHRGNFAWGGSMAILRATFDRIDVRRYWQGAVSDDYGLTRAVQAANLYVKFAPACLTPSLGGCSLAELLEFTTRQIIITRIYSSGRWVLLLISNLLFNLVFFSGLALSVRAIIKEQNFSPLIIIAIIYLLGVWKGYLRIQAIKLMLTEYQQEISRYRWAYYLLAPLVALIFLYNLIASATTNRITWRGIAYELRSSNETIIYREQV